MFGNINPISLSDILHELSSKNSNSGSSIFLKGNLCKKRTFLAYHVQVEVNPNNIEETTGNMCEEIRPQELEQNVPPVRKESKSVCKAQCTANCITSNCPKYAASEIPESKTPKCKKQCIESCITSSCPTYMGLQEEQPYKAKRQECCDNSTCPKYASSPSNSLAKLNTTMQECGGAPVRTNVVITQSEYFIPKDLFESLLCPHCGEKLMEALKQQKADAAAIAAAESPSAICAPKPAPAAADVELTRPPCGKPKTAYEELRQPVQTAMPSSCSEGDKLPKSYDVSACSMCRAQQQLAKVNCKTGFGSPAYLAPLGPQYQMPAEMSAFYQPSGMVTSYQQLQQSSPCQQPQMGGQMPQMSCCQQPQMNSPYEQQQMNSPCQQQQMNSPYEQQQMNSPCQQQQMSSPCQQPQMSSPCQQPQMSSPCQQQQQQMNSPCEQQQMSSPCQQQPMNSPCEQQQMSFPGQQQQMISPCQQQQQQMSSPCQQQQMNSPCQKSHRSSPCQQSQMSSSCRKSKNRSPCQKESALPQQSKMGSCCQRAETNAASGRPEMSVPCQQPPNSSICPYSQMNTGYAQASMQNAYYPTSSYAVENYASAPSQMGVRANKFDSAAPTLFKTFNALNVCSCANKPFQPNLKACSCSAKHYQEGKSCCQRENTREQSRAQCGQENEIKNVPTQSTLPDSAYSGNSEVSKPSQVVKSLQKQKYRQQQRGPPQSAQQEETYYYVTPYMSTQMQIEQQKSTTLLYKEPEFSRKSSNGEVFYDCASGCMSTPKNQQQLVPQNKKPLSLENPQNFHEALLKLTETSQKLLRNFEKAIERKDEPNETGQLFLKIKHKYSSIRIEAGKGNGTQHDLIPVIPIQGSVPLYFKPSRPRKKHNNHNKELKE